MANLMQTARVIKLTFFLSGLLSGFTAATLAQASEEPSPVQVTYECQGTLKAYFHRLTYDGAAQTATGKGFKVVGYPKIENTELSILNSAGFPEYLVHPTMAECGCLPDDQIFVTRFVSSGPQHLNRPTGKFHFELEDGSGYLDCEITLSGV
jgi:hypothetical protein